MKVLFSKVIQQGIQMQDEPYWQIHHRPKEVDLYKAMANSIDHTAEQYGLVLAILLLLEIV